MKEKVKDLARALKQTIDRFGLEVFDNPRQLNAVLMDLLPNYGKERQRIIDTLDTKLVERLIETNEYPPEDIKERIFDLCDYLENELYFSEKLAFIITNSMALVIVNNYKLKDIEFGKFEKGHKSEKKEHKSEKKNKSGITLEEAKELYRLAEEYVKKSHDDPSARSIAVSYCEQAAKAGYTEAEYGMGMYLVSGYATGIPNKRSSKKWFRKAAAKGHVGALEQLRWLER